MVQIREANNKYSLLFVFLTEIMYLSRLYPIARHRNLVTITKYLKSGALNSEYIV